MLAIVPGHGLWEQAMPTQDDATETWTETETDAARNECDLIVRWLRANGYDSAAEQIETYAHLYSEVDEHE